MRSICRGEAGRTYKQPDVSSLPPERNSLLRRSDRVACESCLHTRAQSDMFKHSADKSVNDA
jgi:hypothetical protein